MSEQPKPTIEDAAKAMYNAFHASEVSTHWSTAKFRYWFDTYASPAMKQYLRATGWEQDDAGKWLRPEVQSGGQVRS